MITTTSAVPSLALGALFVIGTGCTKDAARESANKSATSVDTAAAVQSSSPSAPRNASLVGLAYTSLPPGMTLVSGAVIPTSGAQTFDVAHVATPAGDRLLLESAGPKIAGAASHLIVADLALPPMSANERLVMASCDVNGKLDPRVMAVVEILPDRAQFTRVRQAWRADLDGKRFEIIPVDGIVCEEPGSGV